MLESRIVEEVALAAWADRPARAVASRGGHRLENLERVHARAGVDDVLSRHRKHAVEIDASLVACLDDPAHQLVRVAAPGNSRHLPKAEHFQFWLADNFSEDGRGAIGVIYRREAECCARRGSAGECGRRSRGSCTQICFALELICYRHGLRTLRSGLALETEPFTALAFLAVLEVFAADLAGLASLANTRGRRHFA